MDDLRHLADGANVAKRPLKLTSAANLILATLADETLAMANAPEPPAWKRWELAARAERLEHGPRWEPGTLFGIEPHDAATIARFRRALFTLENAGLVELFRPNGRLRNAKLTVAGLALAATLTAGADADDPVGEAALDLDALEREIDLLGAKLEAAKDSDEIAALAAEVDELAQRLDDAALDHDDQHAEGGDHAEGETD